MKHLSNLIIFVISLTFLFPSCDPDFAVDANTCFTLATCAKSSQLTWHVGTATCWCYCEFGDANSESCGNRCQFKKSECQGTVEVSDFEGLNQCKCKCPSGFKDPPNCDIIVGTWAYNFFNSWADPQYPFRQGENTGTEDRDYFPLNEGHVWKYAAFDSAGTNWVSSFAYAIVDTFQLDTLDTSIRIYDFNYYFFDSTDNVIDTLMGLMLYEDPLDSNQVFSYTNSNGPFINHHYNFGDTLFSDGSDFTVADSLGTVTVAAGTFNDCIWLRNQDSSGQILAPDVGMIKVISENLRALELSNYFIHCPFHIEIDTLGVSSCGVNDGKITLHCQGDTSNLSFNWTGPTPIGNIPNPDNLSVGYYRVMVSNGECTNVFDSIPVAGCTSLPVELINFSAKGFNQNVLLKWSTSTEINNDYFQLEHSLDGKSFYPIEKIKGAGTSYRHKDYQYLHRGAVKGLNFYRLKQVDFGGLYEYSEIVSYSINDLHFSFYPNPTSDNLQLIGTSESFNIQIMDLSGKVIYSKLAETGDQIDVSGFTEGMYLLQIQSDAVRETHRLFISGDR